MSASDDALLARQLAAGNTAALGTLIDRYSARLRYHAYAVLRDEDLAADVAQDVFVQLWERRTRLESVTSLGAYLRRMTYNHAVNVRKREFAQGRLRMNSAAEPSAADAADAEVAMQELAHAAQAALHEMTPRVRMIFLLHRVQQLSYAEIAHRLGLAETTVKSQVSRAVRTLAERMGVRL